MTELTIHYKPDPHASHSVPDPHQDVFSKNVLGFWVYLMTDCIIFATLFITYAVLSPNTFGGATPKELFRLTTAFSETMILLVSSLTGGFIVLAAARNRIDHMYVWIAGTFLLGLSFLYLELTEFHEFVEKGSSWEASAFLSSFFTLVGTHGLHITSGLVWLSVLFFQLLFQGLTADTFRRFVIFSLFWHFLDLIWIFIFTFVFLKGVA